jgi:hypothetical protein
MHEPAAIRPMTDVELAKHIPALELALVAAVLDPALAKAEPRQAVLIAFRLIRAAQRHIDWPYKGMTQLSAYEVLAENDAKLDRIPEADRISLAQAFDSVEREHYKTKKGFIAALQKEGLTVFTRDGEEITWKGVATELLRLQTERRKSADRLRKKKPAERIQIDLPVAAEKAVKRNQPKNRQRKVEPKKRNAARQRRKPNA